MYEDSGRYSIYYRTYSLLTFSNWRKWETLNQLPNITIHALNTVYFGMIIQRFLYSCLDFLSLSGCVRKSSPIVVPFGGGANPKFVRVRGHDESEIVAKMLRRLIARSAPPYPLQTTPFPTKILDFRHLNLVLGTYYVTFWSPTNFCIREDYSVPKGLDPELYSSCEQCC